MAISRDELIARAKAEVKQKFAKKDLALMQAVRSLDDLDGAKSILYTRLDEWLKMNFPEMDLQNEESVCRFVEEFACKEDLEIEALEKIVGAERAQRIAALAQKSFGAAFDLEDKQAIRSLAKSIKNIIDTRKEIEDYISTESEKSLKNIAHLTDPMLAARLVTTAGGLERLAKMPGSTVQVIGAETALFKHLRSGTLPPKHGIIFQSAYIRGAPYELRGRIARSLAAKLAIAAKADFFTQHFIAGKLKEDFEKRLDTLNKSPHKEKHEYIPPKPSFAGGRGFGGKPSGGFGGGRREGGRPPFRGGGERREGRPPFREGGRPPFRQGGERRPFPSRPIEGSAGADRPPSAERRPFPSKPPREGGFERREGGIGSNSHGGTSTGERRPYPSKPREGSSSYRPPSGERREGTDRGSGGYRGGQGSQGGSSGYRGSGSGAERRPFKKPFRGKR